MLTDKVGHEGYTFVVMHEEITPLIEAVFGRPIRIELLGRTTGLGETGIYARTVHQRRWRNIKRGLLGFIRLSGVRVTQDARKNISTCIAFLAQRSQVMDDPRIQALLSKELNGTDFASIEDMAALCNALDDDNGPVIVDSFSILRIKGLNHAEGSLQFYFSQPFKYQRTTDGFQTFCQKMYEALEEEDIGQIAGIIVDEIESMLRGITDEPLRQKVQQTLSHQFAHKGGEGSLA